MASRWQCVLVALLFCAAFVTADVGSAEDDDSSRNETDSGKNESHSSPGPTGKPKECDRAALDYAPTCCKLPNAFPKTVIDTCTYEAPVTKPPRGKRAASKGPILKLKITDPLRKRPFTCKSECILLSMNISNNISGIYKTYLGEAFYKAANAAWKPIVNTTVDTCWTNMRSVNTSIPPAAKGACYVKSDMLLTCIYRSLVLNCPASEKNTADKKCAPTTTKLSSCDPYATAKNYKPSGKGK